MNYSKEQLKFIDFIKSIGQQNLWEIDLNPIELTRIAKISYYDMEDLLENLKLESVIEKYYIDRTQVKISLKVKSSKSVRTL